jgi:outer membrane lipopolysaccharide assembly protein LptE/RlpB
MRKINFYLVLIIILLSGCDYKPIYLNKNINFSIKEINTNNQNRVVTKIKNNLIIYSKNTNIEKNYVLNIESEKNKKITSKDTLGNAKTHSLEIIIKLKVFKNNKAIADKKFTEIFNYNTQENKFNLSQYEKNISTNLINKISENIIVYLTSI